MPVRSTWAVVCIPRLHFLWARTYRLRAVCLQKDQHWWSVVKVNENEFYKCSDMDITRVGGWPKANVRLLVLESGRFAEEAASRCADKKDREAAARRLHAVSESPGPQFGYGLLGSTPGNDSSPNWRDQEPSDAEEKEGESVLQQRAMQPPPCLVGEASHRVASQVPHQQFDHGAAASSSTTGPQTYAAED